MREYLDTEGFVHETTQRTYYHPTQAELAEAVALLDPADYADQEAPAPDPREGLYRAHYRLCSDALDLMIKKNQDYACQSDPYRNFRTFGTLGVLVRLSDKLSRLRSFEENNSFAVEDEKLVDTIQDAINYLVIYYQMKQEGK